MTRIISTILPVFVSILCLPTTGLFAQSVIDDQIFAQIHAASTIRESRALLETLVTSLETDAERQRAHAIIGELAELSGDFPDAQRHYRLGYEALDDEHGQRLLLRAAHLLYELGDLASARDDVQHILEQTTNPARRAKARLLLARTQLASGNRTAAISTVRSIPTDESTDAAVLFGLYDLARQLELSEEAQRTRTVLAEAHPKSVEYALVQNDQPTSDRRVERMPTPAQMLVTVPYSPLPQITPESTHSASVSPKRPAPASPPQVAPVESTATQPPERLVAGIQAGSFADPENAAFMARDISNAGFSAEVRERRSGGTVNYQVVVPVSAGTTRDAALQTQIALKEAGIEGFLLYD